MNFIKKALVKFLLGKKLGSFVRHGLTGLGGYLVAQGLASPEVVTEATQSISDGVLQIIQTEDFWGWLMLVLGGGSSVVEKTIR